MDENTEYRFKTIEALFEEVAATDAADLESIIKNTDPKVFACRVHIVGDAYDANVPGNLIQGLSDFQTALFRTYAFAANGKETLRGLTKDDLWVNVTVGKGSTEILIYVASALAVAKMFQNMTPNQKWATLILIGACFCSVEYNNYRATNLELEKAKLQASTVIQHEETERARIQIEDKRIEGEQETVRQAFRSLERVALENSRGWEILDAAQKNSDEASDSLVRSAAGAKQITIRNRVLNEDEIKSIQSPEALPARQSEKEGKFRIVQTNNENHEIWRIQIKGDNDEKISATVILSDLFPDNPDRAKELFDYQKNETLLDIKLSCMKKSYGTFYYVTQLSPAK